MQFADLVKDALDQFVNGLSDTAAPLARIANRARASMQDLTRKQLEQWTASRQCIVTGCQNVAIQRSHTIQKAGPLSRIAENNVVLTPHFNAVTNKVRMRKITTAAASTFPGFCPRHEALFRDFESNRRLKKDIDFILQAYRATCRETVRMQIESAYWKEHKDDFNQAFDRILFSELASIIRARGVDTTPEAVSDFFDKCNNRAHTDALDILIDTELNDLQALEQSHLAMLEQGMFSGVNFESPVGSLTLPEQLPVCLSGLDCINLQSGQTQRRVLLILNVIPEDKLTHLVVSTSLDDQQFIGAYLDRIQGLLAALNTVEAAMLNSTDCKQRLKTVARVG
jgi:hypothetical protein